MNATETWFAQMEFVSTILVIRIGEKNGQVLDYCVYYWNCFHFV